MVQLLVGAASKNLLRVVDAWLSFTAEAGGGAELKRAWPFYRFAFCAERFYHYAAAYLRRYESTSDAGQKASNAFTCPIAFFSSPTLISISIYTYVQESGGRGGKRKMLDT